MKKENVGNIVSQVKRKCREYSVTASEKEMWNIVSPQVKRKRREYSIAKCIERKCGYSTSHTAKYSNANHG